jgi:centromere protein C
MSGRKSSIGGARLLKSHVPYRGDDPTVGRKTGISVAPVPRGSDGFEPFEELMGQIHDSGRPRKRVRRSSERGDGGDGEEDEDGEMSMDVDSGFLVVFNSFRRRTDELCRPDSKLLQYVSSFDIVLARK